MSVGAFLTLGFVIFSIHKGDERKMNQHVKVTFDFTNYNYGTYDLAVPAYLPIKI